MEPVVGLLVFAGLVGWIVALACLRGWVLTVLWAWFVVPALHVTPLSIPEAIGLGLVASMFTHSAAAAEQTDKAKLWIYPVLFPLLSLCVGWIVKGFL